VNRKGNSIIEFALSAAVLFTLLGGTFELGYGMFSYNRLQQAVRAGARYASLRSYDSATATPTNAFLTAVRNVVIYGTPEGGATPVVNGLTPEQVQLSVEVNGSVPTTMTIRITGFPIRTIFTNVQLTGKPAASFPYGGRYTAGF
jgi:Flp pilus assembly protein TadG